MRRYHLKFSWTEFVVWDRTERQNSWLLSEEFWRCLVLRLMTTLAAHLFLKLLTLEWRFLSVAEGFFPLHTHAVPPGHWVTSGAGESSSKRFCHVVTPSRDETLCILNSAAYAYYYVNGLKRSHGAFTALIAVTHRVPPSDCFLDEYLFTLCPFVPRL